MTQMYRAFWLVKSRSINRDIHLFHYLLTSADIKSRGSFTYLRRPSRIIADHSRIVLGPSRNHPRTIMDNLQTIADHPRTTRTHPQMFADCLRKFADRSLTFTDVCGSFADIGGSFTDWSRTLYGACFTEFTSFVNKIYPSTMIDTMMGRVTWNKTIMYFSFGQYQVLRTWPSHIHCNCITFHHKY